MECKVIAHVEGEIVFQHEQEVLGDGWHETIDKAKKVAEEWSRNGLWTIGSGQSTLYPPHRIIRVIVKWPKT